MLFVKKLFPEKRPLAERLPLALSLYAARAAAGLHRFVATATGVQCRFFAPPELEEGARFGVLFDFRPDGDDPGPGAWPGCAARSHLDGLPEAFARALLDAIERPGKRG